MLRIIEKNSHLEIQDVLPASMRLLLVLFGCVPLYAPYELWIVIDWQSYWNVPFLFVSIVASGALLVSIFFFWAGVTGLSQWITFDESKKSVSVVTYSPLTRLQRKKYPFSSVKTVSVETLEWTDGPPTYAICLRFTGADDVRTASVPEAAVVRRIQDRIGQLLERTSTPSSHGSQSSAMKFWELLSAFRKHRNILEDVFSQDAWRVPYLKLFNQAGHLVNQQNREVLDAPVPAELVREIASRINKNYVFKPETSVIRSASAVVRASAGEIEMTTLEVFDRFGGAILEEVQEYGSAKVS